jgi:hypothetical protein
LRVGRRSLRVGRQRAKRCEDQESDYRSGVSATHKRSETPGQALSLVRCDTNFNQFGDPMASPDAVGLPAGGLIGAGWDWPGSIAGGFGHRL